RAGGGACRRPALRRPLGRWRRVRRLGREGQDGLYPARLLAVSRHAGPRRRPGPKLAPDPIPVETFTAFVRTTNRAMPPYSEAILSNDDLADIHAYLQTIPKPADHKSIPLLNQ